MGKKSQGFFGLQNQSHNFCMAGDGPVLPVIPDVWTAPLVVDQPMVEPIRTAEKAGGGKKIKGGGGNRGTKIPTVPMPTAANPMMIRSHL
jgi:hypothetical protein